jgi:hypothetical protein
MAVNIPAGFKVTNADPIDGRIIVNNESERLSFTVNAYEGMLVYQKDTDSLYVLFDTSQKATNNGWKLVSPAGSDKQVQFVSGSSFSGSANLTYNYTTNTLSGTTTQFTTITGSNISGSGANITNITASNITNFTNDVRAQFTQGTNITIVGGVISSTAGGGGTPGGADTQVQFNSGSTFSGSQNLTYDYTNNILSGTTSRFTTITGSNIIGTTGQLTTLSASYISASYIDFDINLVAAPTFRTGRLFYNPDTGDLAYDTSITDIVLNIGQQTVVKVVNNTGAQINKGKLVFISGGVGDNPQINTASWDTDTTSARTIGMVMRDISNGSNGYVILNGVLSGVDTAAYVGGTTLFLSSSGDYTSTRPTQPLHGVRIGEVVRQHATVGSIFINIQNGYELDELHDVLVTTPSQGNLLTYNSSSALWVNSNQLSGNYGITGSLTTTNALTASAISASSPDSKFASATFDNISVTAGAINAVIGNTTQSTGKFTTLSASSTIQAGGAITGTNGLSITGPTTLAGGAGQNVTISTALSVTGPSPTFNNTITASGGITGSSTAQFTTITGSNISSSNFVGSGKNIIDLTGSNITNFTNDVRNQFSAGTGIIINAGAISASNVPNSSLQNSAVSIGSTVISLGTTGSNIQGLTALTSSNITGTTAQFTIISGSNITSSAGLLVGGPTTIGGNLTVNGGQTSVQSFTASAGISSSAGLVIGGNARVLGNITTDNNLIVSGNTTLGNASTDIVTSNAQFTASNGLSASVINVTDKATTRTNLGLGTIATQNANNVAITGGAIDSTAIGATGQSTGKFTSLSASTTLDVGGSVTFGDSSIDQFTVNSKTQFLGNGAFLIDRPSLVISGNIDYDNGSTNTLRFYANQISGSNFKIEGGTINSTSVGATAPSTGKFTSLSASSALDVGGVVTMNSTLTVQGQFAANANVTLGNEVTDTTTINGPTSARDIAPIVDVSYDLGSSSKRWSILYVNDVIASGSNGQVIVGTGSTNSIIECSTGASNTYRGVRSSVGTTEKWFAGADPNDDFVLRKDSVNYLTVDANGKLAIIQASDNNTSGFRIYDADASAKEYWDFFISASATAIPNCLQIRFNGGSEGGFFSSATDVLNIDFTGQHRNIVDNVQDINIDDHKGLIVVSAGKYINTDMSQKPSINESLPTILLSNTRNQKSVWGVISNVEDKNDQTREYRMGVFVSVMTKQNENDNRIIVNSIGEGGIWVCNINGNLENGDYITTCEIPGYGMKQVDDLLHNYTVAKITQDCSFELDNPAYDCVEFQFNGSTYRKAFVGCTYHCG